MSTRFKIERCLVISGGGPVVSGQILEGVVTKGMSLYITFNTDASMTILINGVEFLDHPEGVSEVALLLDYDSDEEARFITTLNLEGQVVDIIDDPAGER